MIHDITSEGKSEQELTLILNLISQHENDEGGEFIKLKLRYLHLCCPAEEFCGLSGDKKEFMVDGLLSDIGTVVVLPIRSSPLATGRPELTCTGIAPVALGFVEWRIP